MTDRIFATAALIYANGPVHLGHLVEYITTDIWARFQRLSGKECIFCCAEDTHGTPIMVRAKKEGSPPEELLKRMRAHLDAGNPARTLAMEPAERLLLRELCLITMKPLMYVANVAEGGFRDNPYLDAVQKRADAEGADVVPVLRREQALQDR